MSEQIIPLVLGGVTITPYAGPIRQRYQPFGGSSEIRMSSGRGHKQTNWRKTATSISASGYLDPALDLLDYTRELELLCVAPKWLAGNGRVYELPSSESRRPDVAPWGLALVSGVWMETSLVLADNIATLAPIPGATGYRVGWMPRLIVFTDGPTTDSDQSSDFVEWTLEAREV